VAGRSFSQYEREPAKEDIKGFDKSKLFFGGNFGLSFGSQTLINVSPQVGYRFNQYFAAGAGVNFIYSSLKSYYTDGSVASRQNLGYAGLNVFGRVYPIQYILLQVQPELNYSWGKYKQYDPDAIYSLPGKFVPSLLLGAGGAIPAGRGAFVIMGQYDVVQDPRGPYGNNIFLSFGYNIGF
jgi:hypothetical protein